MAAIARVGTPSVSSVPLDPNDKLSNRIAGEDIKAVAPCQIADDGLIYHATDRVDGWSMTSASAGETVTLTVTPCRYRYGNQGVSAPDMVPGTLLYLDPLAAGDLNDLSGGASGAGTGAGAITLLDPVALALDNGVLQTAGIVWPSP